jgi:L,D-transpeptidase ErfK/SrfK
MTLSSHYLLVLVMAALPAWATLNATTFPLPPAGEALVGVPWKITTRYEDTLIDIARLHGLGFTEIRQANPTVDAWLPGEGTEVILPTSFVLPDAPRQGIIINVAEMRLYFFPKAKVGERSQVVTYPVSIGRGNWQTPLVSTTLTAKVKNPTWYPPESVRKEHAADGNPLPKAVPPGHANPLGGYALRLGLASYLIHGTNKPYGIGMRVTHGCIRLYPEDIKALFEVVPIGTPVRIINQPYKAGWHRDELYLEVHAPLSHEQDAIDRGNIGVDNLTPVVAQVVEATQGKKAYQVDWDKVQTIVHEQAGIPVSVARSRQAVSAADTFAAKIKSAKFTQGPLSSPSLRNLEL